MRLFPTNKTGARLEKGEEMTRVELEHLSGGNKETEITINTQKDKQFAYRRQHNLSKCGDKSTNIKDLKKKIMFFYVSKKLRDRWRENLAYRRPLNF